MARWLASEGLAVAATDNGEVMEITIPESDDRKLRIIVVDDGDFIVFSMVTQAVVTRKKWTALYPLLSDANGEIVFGAWVLDPDAERIAFRAAIPGKNAIYEPQALRRCMAYVARTVSTMESNFRGTVEDDVLSAWMSEPTTSEIPIFKRPE